MKIGFVQFAPVLGDRKTTIERAGILLEKACDADLLVLPELADTGYNFSSRAEALKYSDTVDDNAFIGELRHFARLNDQYIVTGFCEREGDVLYNSAILLGPQGVVGRYRKLHLFMNEKDIFQPGNEGLPVFEIPGCRVGMLVCFDWEFPEVWRVLALRGADIICHPSNLVLPGRCQSAIPVHALCNRVFIVTANRVGKERDLTFTGNSIISDTNGNIIAAASADTAELMMVDINPEEARDKYITPRNDIFADRRPDQYRDICRDGAE
ncbi:MAG TPA: carbon-nitrogen hydrolase [Phycisphaeraceae bacterium]|nr:carbon-nitrogen hydrolase [Phycisphaeraceae bacterium]